MRNAHVILAISCGLALATACSSSSSNTTPDAGNTSDDATVGDDGAANSGDDGSLLGTPTMMLPDATITCHGAVDCGGDGHSCCFSTMTFSTMCVMGTCGSNYTQCVSMDSECPAGLQCVPSPLGMGVHYCAMGDGGGARDAGPKAEGGAPESGAPESGAPESGAPEGGGTDSGSDATNDGPAE
jgi:hypothetical protein